MTKKKQQAKKKPEPPRFKGQVTGAAKTAQSAKVQQTLSTPQVGQRPAPPPPPPAPAPAPSVNSSNKQIQNALSSAGNTVSYKEATAVAANLGVSVDRVYNQTAKTGQGAKAGAAAANAGYTPGENLKVNNPIAPTYITQATSNYNRDLAAAQEQDNAAGTLNGDGTTVPEFDWAAWNTEMASQQAAIWSSMDAMNSEFMRQQQEWMTQQKQTPTATARSGGGVGGFGGADQAQVKRKKKKKTVASGSTNTGLSIGNSGGSGVSLGGSSAGGLSIGKG